jgi:hypothetical protein
MTRPVRSIIIDSVNESEEKDENADNSMPLTHESDSDEISESH